MTQKMLLKTIMERTGGEALLPMAMTEMASQLIREQTETLCQKQDLHAIAHRADAAIAPEAQASEEGRATSHVLRLGQEDAAQVLVMVKGSVVALADRLLRAETGTNPKPKFT